MISRNAIISIGLSVLILLPTTSFAACVPLARTLRLGQKGEDVRALQVFLNKNSATALATTGDGSPGHETTYFGPRMKDAVKRFQVLHKSEVLTPLGLKLPSGFIGKFSLGIINASICKTSTASPVTVAQNATGSPQRATTPTAESIEQQKKELTAKIAQLIATMGKSSTSTTAPSSATALAAPMAPAPPVVVTTPTQAVDPNAPLLLYGFNTSVTTRGQTLMVSGSGIVSGAELELGTKRYPVRIMSPGVGGTIDLPSDAPLGKYYARLYVGSKKSNERILVIAEDLQHQPIIDSISPDSGNYGTIVTITGSGFTSSNDIFTSLERISNISSPDGKTITFAVHADPLMLKSGKLIAGAPYAIRVVNTQGISGVVQFSIK